MNKKQVVANLKTIANQLDNNGLYNEANEVTEVMVRISQSQYPISEQDRATSAIENARSKFSDGDKRAALKELGQAGAKIADPQVKGQLLKVYQELQKSNPPIKMPKYDLNIPMPYDNIPGLSSKPNETPKSEVSAKPNKPNASDDSLPSLDIPMPYDVIPGLSSKPKPKDSSEPSKPGSSKSSTPQTVEGLDRWVNKAENIYNAWGQKGAKPSSDAFGLVKDIVDYMDKVKSNLPTSLHSAADAKIAKVQEMLRNIFDEVYNPALALTALPYGVMGGYPGKDVNPFEEGRRLTGKDLDYQARQEGKSY